MKTLLLTLSLMMASLSLASAAADLTADARYAIASKYVSSTNQLAVFVKGAC